MYTEIINELYENDAVEGVALFNDHGDLVENQLALGEGAVTKIGISLNRIRAGLLTSSREMNGFLLKTDEYLLQAIIHHDCLILLQVEPTSSANQNYNMVKSQLGDRPVMSEPEQVTVKRPIFESQQVARDVLVEPKVSEPEVIVTEDIVDWAEFRASLASLIKRVAPSGVANKMISNASIEAGIILDQDTIELKKAIIVGSNVVSKIPNASRRKLIENEYKIMVQKFQV